MGNDRNYWTQRRPDGKWESRREGAQRAAKVTKTQAEAWNHSREKAGQGGGEAYLKGRNGQIRARNTYGKDPFPPRG